MRLTSFSDYSLRVLMYLGVHEGRLATVGEIAAVYRVSEHHLVKVVHRLGQLGYIETLRGKGGGMRLARPPHKIGLGAVLRGTEDSLSLVECFEAQTCECRIDSACLLKGILARAMDAFFAELDRHTLADLLGTRSKLAKILVQAEARPRSG